MRQGYGNKYDSRDTVHQASHRQYRGSPDLIWVLQRKAAPDEHDERERQDGVLHALDRKHAHLAGHLGVERGLRHTGGPQPDQFAQPIAQIVQEHQSDRDRNENQIKSTHPPHLLRLNGPLGDVDGTDGETRSRARMALAACLGKVGGVDHRFGIARRQNTVDSMATGAVGYGLHSCLGGQAMERGVEAHHAVLRESELAGEAQVSVAAPAGLANMCTVHRRSSIGVLDDSVLAMTVGAERRLGDTAREGLSMHAAAVLLDDFGMAHPAGIGRLSPEFLGTRRQQFVGAAVAQRAIRGTGIAVARGLSMRALLVVLRLAFMTSRAGGFGHSGGVGIVIVTLVAGGAGQLGVRALGKLLRLIVTGGAIRRPKTGSGSKKQAENQRKISKVRQLQWLTSRVERTGRP